MIDGASIRVGEIGDGAGDFEDAIVSTGAEVQIRRGELQQLFRVLVEFAELLQLPRPHVRVAGDMRLSVETFVLTFPCSDNTFANLS